MLCYVMVVSWPTAQVPWSRPDSELNRICPWAIMNRKGNIFFILILSCCSWYAVRDITMMNDWLGTYSLSQNNILPLNWRFLRLYYFETNCMQVTWVKTCKRTRFLIVRNATSMSATTWPMSTHPSVCCLHFYVHCSQWKICLPEKKSQMCI